MIQCYEKDNTNYDANGDITLLPTQCELSTEINSTWELTMSHPLDPEGRWKYLSEEAVISVPTFQGEHQLFRVDKCIKTDASVEVTAYPIFFDSADDCFLLDTRPTNQNGQNALNIMTQGSKYSGESDITTGGTAYFVRRNLMDAINGEDSPTFIGTWGGEILYDNFKVIINERIGGDYGVEIRYGKNMNGLSYTVDMSDVVTRIVPVAYNGRTMSGNTPWVDSENIDKYAKKYIREVKFEDVKLAEDASDSEDDNIIICADQTALDAALTQKCEDMYAAGADLPAVTIEVTMIDLAKTEQYKDFENLVTVGLGDTVHCYNYKLGITTDARVIKLTWDCIKNQAGEMTLGDYEYNYFSDLTSSLQAIQQVIGPGNTLVAERVSGVLNAINTQLRYQKNVAQTADVRAILFEDTNEESPTYGAMCLGTQGLQIADSRTADGRDWDWTTAFTAKGGYANTLIAGLLSDKTGRSYWNLDTGELQVNGTIISNSAEITGGHININTADSNYSGVRLNAEDNTGSKYNTLITPSSFRAMYDIGGDKVFALMSSGVFSAGTYGGTYDNPGPFTSKTRIYQGDITCENLTQTSDARLKDDIKDIPDELAEKIIYGVIPRMFRRKGREKISFGYIAQEVKRVTGDKYSIFEDENDKNGIHSYMSVSYIDFIALIVKILQMQKEEIEEMKRGDKRGESD